MSPRLTPEQRDLLTTTCDAAEASTTDIALSWLDLGAVWSAARRRAVAAELRDLGLLDRTAPILRVSRAGWEILHRDPPAHVRLDSAPRPPQRKPVAPAPPPAPPPQLKGGTHAERAVEALALAGRTTSRELSRLTGIDATMLHSALIRLGSRVVRHDTRPASWSLPTADGGAA